MSTVEMSATDRISMVFGMVRHGYRDDDYNTFVRMIGKENADEICLIHMKNTSQHLGKWLDIKAKHKRNEITKEQYDSLVLGLEIKFTSKEFTEMADFLLFLLGEGIE